MNWFFQIQSLQLLIFCMDDQEFVANFDYVFFFFCNIIKVNHFFYRFIILLYLISFLSPTRSFLVTHAYVSIKSFDCILLSLFDLKIIFLISSVKTLRLSLSNVYCVFDIDILFLMNSLWFFKGYLC